MFGKVEELIVQVHPASRLRSGLALLRDYREGRLPEFDRVLAGLKAGEKAEIAIAGDTLRAILQHYSPKPRDEGRFEAHQCHTDLQYLSEGAEWIDVCDLHAQSDLPPFDARGNVYFPLGTAAHSRVRLNPGEVAVLFPSDAHAPCLRVEDVPDTLVRKIVIKVKDALRIEVSAPLR
jgi:biofilm protein TabA